MKHFLLIEDDEGKRTVELQTASSSIGRDPRNSIVLNSREISRQHAVLLRLPRPGDQPHQFRIIDGNFQGKPSTNGLLINGVPRSSHDLCHGDEIVFAATVDARYFVIEKGDALDRLLSNQDEATDYLATLPTRARFADYKLSEAGASNNAILSAATDDSSLERLASFPELFPHPIIEISVTGELTYLNPAAVAQFPELQTDKLEHPLLSTVIELVEENQQQQSMREVKIGDRTFEQAINYIPQSELIRLYVLDITSRREAEDVLKSLHRKLEEEFEMQTRKFNEATDRLRQEEQALLASYATNRALLNAIPDPMFRIDCEGTVVNFKAPKQHTLPFDPQECLHCNLSEMLPAPAVQGLQQCINAALLSEEIQVMEFMLGDLNFEARIAVSAPEEVMVILRDITERKRSEADILNALAQERELNELRTKFVAMTSHEFRTPLTTILSSAELLKHYSDHWEQEKQFEYLEKIRLATRHMIDLLNDVLLLNKTEAGKLEFNPQPLALSEFCREIIEELQITTAEHQLRLDSPLSSNAFLLDRKLLRHILTNLLSNAINYSPNGGEILVSIACENASIVLSVKDSGIGIPEENRVTLFDSFIRGSNVGGISGTGLGLAIVKRSVELHQGRIDCESKVGEGTTFVVQIPTCCANFE
ncbi:MAG: ATP-binding protein [Cyanobacteria bacterium J06623_4]